MATRKQVRDTAKEQIKAVYAGEVFTGRIVYDTKMSEYVNVFLVEGENEEDGLQLTTNAQLVLGIHKSGPVTDDDLDQLGATAENGLLSDPSLGGLVHGIRRTGFVYEGREETQFEKLYLLYNVVF